MTYPTTTPTSRSFSYGNYPVKTSRMMDGFETRILLGSKRTGVSMQLQYNNIADDLAKNFLDHFESQKGTYLTFDLPAGATTGMSSSLAGVIPGVSDTQWRWAEPPAVTSVYPGVSSVSVKLVAVLV